MKSDTLLLIGVVVTAVIVGGIAVTKNSDWKKTKNASKYLPLLNEAEEKYGIPRDLLARLAYQESRFREDIVRGETVSAAGALGIMQLVPRFHPMAQPLDVALAIDYAAGFLASLRRQLGSWTLALAGYNAGAGNVLKYKGVPPFAETLAYVSEIKKDVAVV